MKYFFDFCDDISRALKNMTVVDRKGDKVPMQVAFDKFADLVKEIAINKSLIFFCGNGASCTMAEHMSHDFFQNAEVNTQTCSETSHITAISNDISYDDVFSYRINRIMGNSDMLFAISSSGNSKNIVKAVNAARNKGSFIVTMSGKNENNTIRGLGDLNFHVNMPTYGMVEASHAVLQHALLDYYLDKYSKGRH